MRRTEDKLEIECMLARNSHLFSSETLKRSKRDLVLPGNRFAPPGVNPEPGSSVTGTSPGDPGVNPRPDDLSCAVGRDEGLFRRRMDTGSGRVQDIATTRIRNYHIPL